MAEISQTVLERRPWVLAAAAVVALHLLCIWLPFVNQEGAFNAAATYFWLGGQTNIQAFFDQDANTLMIPAMGGALSATLGIDVEYGNRLLSIIGIPIFTAAIYSMAVGQRQNLPMAVLVLVLLNPLVWIFAGRGTADFLPMAIATAGIALSWERKAKTATLLLAASIFALSALTKYHALILLPLIALGPNPDKTLHERMRAILLVGLITVAALVMYNVVVFRSFGFWVTSPKWMNAFRFSSANTINNLVNYSGYLALLVLPMSLQAAFSNATSGFRYWGLAVCAFVTAFGLGWFFGQSSGEMNFGPFDRWIGAGFSGAVLSAMSVVFALSLYSAASDRRSMGVAGAIVVFICVLSLTRPAQRYLLLILPFYYLLLAQKIDLRRWLVPTLAVYVVLVGIATYAQLRWVPHAAVGVPFGQSREF